MSTFTGGDTFSSGESGVHLSQQDGNPSGPASKPRQRAKANPKMVMYGMFIVLEAVMVGLFALQLHIWRTGLLNSDRASVAEHVVAVNEGIEMKIDGLAMASGLLVQDTALMNFMVNRTGYDTVLSRFRLEQASRQNEYYTLVDTNFRILCSVNQRNRTGEYFNPSNIVTLASMNLNSSHIAKHIVVSYHEMFEVEGAPVIRNRQCDLCAAMKHAHPWDIKSPAVVKFVVTPVFQTTNARADAKVPLGYLLVGDLSSGQSTLAADVATAIGGYVGYYLQDESKNNTLAEVTGQEWIAVSRETYLDIKDLNYRVDTMDFDPVDPSWDVFNNMLLAGGRDVQVRSDSVNGYLLGGSAMRDTVYPNNDSIVPLTNGTILRGIPLWMNDLRPVLERTWGYFLAGALVLDMMIIFLALFLFLLPLEKLGRQVRSGAALDLKYVQRLVRRRHALYLVLALNLGPLGISVAQWFKGAHFKAEAIGMRSDYYPGFLYSSYRLQMDSMVTAWSVLGHHEAVAAALAPHRTSADLDSCMEVQQRWQNTYWNDLGALVNCTDKRIISHVNTHNLVGTVWDPLGLVTKVSQDSSKYAMTAIVSYDTIAAAEVPPALKTAQFNSSCPLSGLYPKAAGQSGLIIYTALPAWGPDTDRSEQCDGVLISGWTVSGTTIMAERANYYLDGGYSGIYFWTEAGGFQLVTGVWNEGQVTTAVDVSIPDTHLLEKVRDAGYASTETFSDVMVIHKRKVAVSASCYVENYKIDTTGLYTLGQWDHAPGKCLAMLVQGRPYEVVAAPFTQAMAMQAYNIVVQATKVVVMCLLCWKVYQPFQKIILNKKGAIRSRQPAGKQAAPQAVRTQMSGTRESLSQRATSQVPRAGRVVQFGRPTAPVMPEMDKSCTSTVVK